MTFGVADLPGGLRLRMTKPSDAAFERRLHDANRQDLTLIDGSRDFLESIFDMQHRARDAGYGAQFPDAMYYIIERQGEAIGRLVLDFGCNEVRVVDIALTPAAQGQGAGSIVLNAIKQVAANVPCPVTLTVSLRRPDLFRLYAGLGFTQDPEAPPRGGYALLRWTPGAADMVRTQVLS